MNAPTQNSPLLARLRSWAQSRVAMLDQNQSGAIALACLASFVILVMTALVLYDAGFTARAKIDAQNAADTAAYSQAAVKARTMNMVMYTNVAKRTIVSLHNIYFGMYTAWVAWTAKRCAKAAKCKCIFCPSACWDCAINTALAIAELPDTIKYFTDVADRYNKELKALSKYQDYMMNLTPWWAWAEGTVRGSRNGASFTSSFPPPPGLMLTMVPDWIDKALNFFGFGSLYNQTHMKDEMPLKKGSWYQNCMVPFTQSFTEAGVLEFGINVAIHRQRSKEGAKKGSNIAAGAALAITGGCLYSYARFGSAMAPVEPTNSGTSATDLMKKSNVVFSYKMSPETRGILRKNYDIHKQNYSLALPNMIDRSSGFWTLSRGEFYFDKDSTWTIFGTKPDPFKPGWTAKIRPVALPNEMQQLNADINAMYHDIAPYMGLAALLSIGQDMLGGGGGSFSAAWGDAIYMEKATRTLDNGVINGLNK